MRLNPLTWFRRRRRDERAVANVTVHAPDVNAIAEAFGQAGDTVRQVLRGERKLPPKPRPSPAPPAGFARGGLVPNRYQAGARLEQRVDLEARKAAKLAHVVQNIRNDVRELAHDLSKAVNDLAGVERHTIATREALDEHVSFRSLAALGRRLDAQGEHLAELQGGFDGLEQARAHFEDPNQPAATKASVEELDRRLKAVEERRDAQGREVSMAHARIHTATGARGRLSKRVKALEDAVALLGLELDVYG